jgi:hypothetical protein
VALSDDEKTLITEHRNRLDATSWNDELLLKYYQGIQDVTQLGMAIPPDMRKFLVIANWCRTLVDTINSRQQVRHLILPGEETADPRLKAIWDASSMSAHVSMFNRDRMIYGRAFMSVGANEDDSALPFVRVESPREMTAIVDVRRERVTSACRFYGWDETTVTSSTNLTTTPVASTVTYGVNASKVTLYLPDETIWCEKDQVTGEWVDVDRDAHRLGYVPVAMHLNRRMSGQWVGESQMSDVIPLVDAAARSLTNLQFAQEAHGIPRIFMTGVARGDFKDANGDPIPQFQAYFDAIHMLTNPESKVGQLTPADLKNFETAIDLYGKQASTVTGFPARYFGLQTVNPPAEGAIYADEAPLNRSVEEQNEQVGTTLGSVGRLMWRFATNEWLKDRVYVDWFDPGTPTVAQREDALSKRRAVGVLSREGYWDELGWSEGRKAKERAYFEAEMAEMDPYLKALASKGAQDADPEPAQVG